MNIREFAIVELKLNFEEYKSRVEGWEHAGKDWVLQRVKTDRFYGARDEHTGRRDLVEQSTYKWSIEGTNLERRTQGREPEPIPTFEKWVEAGLKNNLEDLQRQVEKAGGIEEYVAVKEAAKKVKEAKWAAINRWVKLDSEVEVEGYDLYFRHYNYKLEVVVSKGVKSFWKDWKEDDWAAAFEEYPAFLEKVPELHAEWEKERERQHRIWLAEKVKKDEEDRIKFDPIRPACERLAQSLEKKGYKVKRDCANPRDWGVRYPNGNTGMLLWAAKSEKLLIPKSLL